MPIKIVVRHHSFYKEFILARNYSVLSLSGVGHDQVAPVKPLSALSALSARCSRQDVVRTFCLIKLARTFIVCLSISGILMFACRATE